MIRASSLLQNRRRRIGPEAGRALEMLGHAIDYLADEYIHRGGIFSEQDPEFEALNLLMERNREIYLACPEVPGWRDRFESWWHFKPHHKA